MDFPKNVSLMVGSNNYVNICVGKNSPVINLEHLFHIAKRLQPFYPHWNFFISKFKATIRQWLLVCAIGNRNFSSFINSFFFSRLKYEFMLAQRNCYWLISQQKLKTPIASYLNVNHCVIRYNRNEKCDLNKMEKEKTRSKCEHTYVDRPERKGKKERVSAILNKQAFRVARASHLFVCK